jgi:hypothetical protein
MKYNFDFKMQAIYGIVTFLTSFAVVYMITKKIDWISPTIIGLINFIVSGYYKYEKCKK